MSDEKKSVISVPSTTTIANTTLANAKNTPTVQKTLSGTFEKITNITNTDFEALRNQFKLQNYVKDPSNEHHIIGIVPEDEEKIEQKKLENLAKRKRTLRGTADDPENFMGPWAPFEGDKPKEPLGPSPEERARYLHEASQSAKIKVHLTDQGFKLLPGEERTIFHGKQERDQFGRTFLFVPEDIKEQAESKSNLICYAPKRVVHTWSGHTKGVNTIKFFPNYGHLLLSGSQDARVKIWSTLGNRECLRTFIGHSKPVKDICFSSTEGTSFASLGYDRYIKHWDTETGTCLNSIQYRALMYCLCFAPEDPNCLLAGTQDKKIVQWDIREPKQEPVLVYDQHLDAISTITFLNSKRFMTCSEDRTIRLWELNVPQTFKMIQEPGIGQVASTVLHPQEPFISLQTYEDSIITLNTEKHVRQRRVFTGHETLGFPCQLTFSPDGRYLASGDGRGRLFIWDWNNGNIVRKIEGQHEKVLIGVAWNPLDSNGLATCSWDGTIKYWQ